MEWLWPVLIVVGVLLLVGIYLWSTYNSLVQLKVRVDEAWSGITVQLKRRADLIPNLIETVRGYAAHEKEVIEGVTRARAETLAASVTSKNSRSVKPRPRTKSVLGNTLILVFSSRTPPL